MFKIRESDKEIPEIINKNENTQVKSPKIKNIGEIITMLREKHLKSKLLSKDLFCQFDTKVIFNIILILVCLFL